MKNNEPNEENGNDSEQITGDDLNGKETEMEIEGIVQGEADNNVVQSAGQTNVIDADKNKVNFRCFY